tara:strand:- start:75 stop:623 length:549 start_codon:yes stop_codon:yes gene_type:complete
MALWGRSELVYNTGKVNVHFTEKEIRRHSGGIDFTTAGIQTGDVITIGTGVNAGAGSTVGYAIVSGIVGVHTLSIFGTGDLVGSGTILSQDYYINEKPKYVLGDSTYDAPEVQSNRTVAIVGVDETEAGVARTTAYKVPHAGWVGIQTYTDMHGNLRVKSETLVAASGITSDRVTNFTPGLD